MAGTLTTLCCFKTPAFIRVPAFIRSFTVVEIVPSGVAFLELDIRRGVSHIPTVYVCATHPDIIHKCKLGRPTDGVCPMMYWPYDCREQPLTYLHCAALTASSALWKHIDHSWLHRWHSSVIWTITESNTIGQVNSVESIVCSRYRRLLYFNKWSKKSCPSSISWLATISNLIFSALLPRDATQSAVVPQYVACRGPKSVHSGNGLPLLALRHLCHCRSVRHFEL